MREAGDDLQSTQSEVDYVVLPAGRKIGRFEVVSVLGQGSFGITYRARDLQLGRDVAIKEYLPAALAIRSDGTTVRPRSTATAEDFLWGRERFVEEGRTIATLHDAPGIVRVFDFLETNGTAYIVMELVRGETLDARLRRDGTLDAAAVERILGPLLAGLEQVHEAGFLHRDIKPGNILLDGRGNPTLIDFGASRAAMANRTVAMTAIFTPGYAAVEQFTSAKQGPWTDIYGVSATLYHAITGKASPSAIERMLDDTCAPLARLAPAGFPAGLLAGLDAGLAVRAAERPQSIAAWRDVLSGGAATVALARPTRAAKAAEAPAPRSKRALWIGAAAATVLLLAGGGYLAFEPGKSSAPAPASSAAGDRQRIEQEVRRAREALAAAEQASQRQADQDAKEAAEAEARRKAAAEVADKQRADEAARRRAAAQTEQQRQEAEAARQKADAEAQAQRRADAEEAKRKADAEAAERARIQQEVTKAREALAQAEAARLQAEAETARLQAAAEARQKADAEAAAREKADAEARQKADAEAATKAKGEAEAAAKQKAEVDAAARLKADAEAATKQKSDDELRKAGEAAEATLRLSVVDRQRLQVALTALGFDTRGADGAFGPRSREMLAAWQRRQNQPPTGYLTATQQQALLREAAPAIAKYDDDQKKAEEAKRKAEEEAKARAPQQPPAATAPAPAAAPAPQAPAGGRDGLWFGAIDCKQSGRQSVQGSVSNGSGRLSGNNLQLTLTISGASASVVVSAQQPGGPSGPLSGELRGRSVYAKGSLPRFGGGQDECSVSLVGP
jgi:peptidoglycan hydrolase-like protein with peptidoglycan-binding domain